MEIISGWYWKKGKRKVKNEDSILICQMIVKRKTCFMAAICDGIGSLKNGEIASGYVTEELINWFYRDVVSSVYESTRKSALLNMGKRELWRIHKTLKDYWKQESVGTTLSLLLVIQGKFFLWNAGDSRIYMGKENGKYRCITEDDLYKGNITRAIGSCSFRGVSCSSGKLRKRTRFLIASDGFYKKLSQQTMDALMNHTYIHSEKQVESALKEAGMRVSGKGEEDDISAIFVQLDRKEKSIRGG